MLFNVVAFVDGGDGHVNRWPINREPYRKATFYSRGQSRFSRRRFDMSTLFNIAIDSVDGRTVRARFEVCHPDQWDVPATKNIALITIVEIYDNMKRGLGFAGQPQPIAEKAASSLLATHPQKRRLEGWLRIMNEWDGAKFAAEATKAIADAHLEHENGNPKKADGDRDPKATLAFVVNDAGILFHVVPGFRFGSAMCDCVLW